MDVVAFVTQKGGTGKSTLAVDLAVTAEQHGERAVILDLDPQGTVASWRKTRRFSAPAVLDSLDGRTLQDAVSRLAIEGFTLALLDTAKVNCDATAAAIHLANLCIVPVRPSEADVRSTLPTLRVLTAASRPYVLVVNQAPSRLLTDVSVRLHGKGPVSPVVVAARIDHQYAYALGLGVQEYAPQGKATAEIVALWQEIRRRLGRADDIRSSRNAAELEPRLKANLALRPREPGHAPEGSPISKSRDVPRGRSVAVNARLGI